MVHGGVPVALVEDDRVRGGEVDAQPARARAEQEHEVLVFGLELGHSLTPGTKPYLQIDS